MQMDNLRCVFMDFALVYLFVFSVPFDWLFHWMSHLRSELVVCLCKISGFVHGSQIEVKDGIVST